MTRAVPPIIPGVEMLSGSQPINGSLKFDQSKKTYLKRTPGSAGNRRTWTYSAWIRRGDLELQQKEDYFLLLDLLTQQQH